MRCAAVGRWPHGRNTSKDLGGGGWRPCGGWVLATGPLRGVCPTCLATWGVPGQHRARGSPRRPGGPGRNMAAAAAGDGGGGAAAQSGRRLASLLLSHLHPHARDDDGVQGHGLGHGGLLCAGAGGRACVCAGRAEAGRGGTRCGGKPWSVCESPARAQRAREREHNPTLFCFCRGVHRPSAPQHFSPHPRPPPYDEHESTKHTPALTHIQPHTGKKRMVATKARKQMMKRKNMKKKAPCLF